MSNQSVAGSGDNQVSTPDTMRAAFEAWALSKHCPADALEKGGDYGGSGTLAGMWVAWQAGAAAERAKVADLFRALESYVRW